MSVEAVGGVLGRVLESLGLSREMTGWRAVEAWPDYASYQTKTERVIPLFVLVPVTSAE